MPRRLASRGQRRGSGFNRSKEDEMQEKQQRREASSAQLWRANSLGLLALREEPGPPIENAVIKEVPALPRPPASGFPSMARGALSVPDFGAFLRRAARLSEAGEPPSSVQPPSGTSDRFRVGRGRLPATPRLRTKNSIFSPPRQKTTRPYHRTRLPSASPSNQKGRPPTSGAASGAGRAAPPGLTTWIGPSSQGALPERRSRLARAQTAPRACRARRARPRSAPSASCPASGAAPVAPTTSP